MFAATKVVSLVLVINLIAGGAYALAVQNTVADGAPVYKTDMVRGYDVTGIVFDLDDTNPDAIDSITFRVAPSHGSAKVDHVAIQTQKDGPWTECALADDILPTRVATCTFESLAVEDMTALDIVAK